MEIKGEGEGHKNGKNTRGCEGAWTGTREGEREAGQENKIQGRERKEKTRREEMGKAKKKKKKKKRTKRKKNPTKGRHSGPASPISRCKEVFLAKIKAHR